MNINSQLKSDVMVIHLDVVRMTDEKFEEYNKVIASKIGADARAFMRKDNHGYFIVEVWNNHIPTRMALRDEIKRIQFS